ncbi:unnamed protein product [Phaedon cochleariae]|uniref:Uncharacterized protein n=1 Tax=Phaedon cochleariae TaxID=80249 RepID=A0A9N9SC73_PHACE|nr:unnamed protein product [Phaedon cochleariae]
MFEGRITPHKSDCERNLGSYCSLAEHIILALVGSALCAPQGVQLVRINTAIDDNSGQYKQDNSGAYNGDDGQYHPDGSGAYRGDILRPYQGVNIVEKPYILALIETKVKSFTNTTCMLCPGYELPTRSRFNGGLRLYAETNLSCHKEKLSKPNELNVMWFEVDSLKQIHLSPDDSSYEELSNERYSRRLISENQFSPHPWTHQKHHLQTEKPDILALTETQVNSSTNKVHMLCPGYELHSRFSFKGRVWNRKTLMECGSS